MNTILALILSLVMMFSSVATTGTTASTTVPAPAEQTTTAVPGTVGTADYLRSTPSDNSRVVGSVTPGQNVSVLRTATVLGKSWTLIRANGVKGWVASGSMQNQPKTQEAIPDWAKWGVVKNDYLNIRSGAGVNNDKIGEYRFGDHVAILEYNLDWGRTVDGWICLDYLYMDGTLGEHPTEGIVTANQLNVRKGPSTEYPVVKYYFQNDRIQVLEQFIYGNTTWGCTKDGWISMAYVDPVKKPDPTKPTEAPTTPTEPSGDYNAVVYWNDLNVYDSPYGNLLKVIHKGEKMIITATDYAKDREWGKMADGWVMMEGVSMVTPPGPGPTPPTEPVFQGGTFSSDEAEVTLASTGNNGFTANVSIFRLANMDGTGVLNGNQVNLTLTDPSENTLKATFSGSTLTITESTWEYLPAGTSFSGLK